MGELLRRIFLVDLIKGLLEDMHATNRRRPRALRPLDDLHPRRPVQHERPQDLAVRAYKITWKRLEAYIAAVTEIRRAGQRDAARDVDERAVADEPVDNTNPQPAKSPINPKYKEVKTTPLHIEVKEGAAPGAYDLSLNK